jgi:hypothetical protein
LETKSINELIGGPSGRTESKLTKTIQKSTFETNTAKTSKQSTPNGSKKDKNILVHFHFIGPFIRKKKSCDWPQSGRIKKKSHDCIRKNVEIPELLVFVSKTSRKRAENEQLDNMVRNCINAHSTHTENGKETNWKQNGNHQSRPFGPLKSPQL